MLQKKTVAALLALVLLIGSLAGCSARAGQQSEPAPAPESVAESLEMSTANSAREPSIFDPPPEPAPEPLRPDQDAMMALINALCGEPRPIGSEQERQAALLLQKQLGEIGYIAELEPFEYDITSTTQSERYNGVRTLTGDAFFTSVLPRTVTGTSQNVVARQPGQEEKELVLVLTAHYDSTSDSIGVIDNAAGVAVTLEAARILAAEDLPFAIQVVLFGGEESILIGSRNHLLGLSEAERARIVANINTDTVAYRSQTEGFVILVLDELPQNDPAALRQASPVAAAFLADGRVSAEIEPRLVGDYMAYAALGIDAINYGQSLDDVRDLINRPTDTYDLLVPELLPDAVDVLVGAVRELARQLEA